MSAPTVAAVMLANGRPEMVSRAIKSFLAQTYENKRLLIWDSSPGLTCCDQLDHNGVVHVPAMDGGSIGCLRNEANSFWTEYPIIVHWDSDDWSHPNRIAEQVALLQASGAECVGYNEMLFWDACAAVEVDLSTEAAIDIGEAWLYRAAVPNYAVGTSMAYWRDTWKRNQFPDLSEGCDDLEWFNRGVKIESVSAAGIRTTGVEIMVAQPTMIASIHGGNTCAKIDATKREWLRVPEWDAYCRSAMQL